MSSRFAWMPGLSLSICVTVTAYAVEAAERAVTGKAWLEALVLAILIGTAIRSLWTPAPRWRAGIAFGARYPLEVAVALLGVSVQAATVIAAGPMLLFGIAGVVATAIPMSFAVGRLLGLPARMALLVACGNSICGNSAIAAVAPVIGADNDDVAASIAFTAVLGVVVVLALPLLGSLLGMGGVAFGALAGLTVYAVPQVIAAASPMGAAAIQAGTLVKLVRVLMLGPVCLALSLAKGRTAARGGRRGAGLSQLVPWFIIGFLAAMGCRALGLVPTAAIGPIGQVTTFLTVVSMAALGLGVDVRAVAKAGGRVTAAAILSLIGLIGLSLAFLAAIHLG